MTQKIYQVDAFTNELFRGNPAAVCPLKNWLKDEIMQNIAMENNLAETAFYVKNGESYEIRWFTPTVEVDLCGHATLAAAYVLFFQEGYENETIQFISPRRGNLFVKKENEWLILDFPTDTIEKVDITDEILSCFDIKPVEAYQGKTDLMLIFSDENEIQHLVPSFQNIVKIEARGLIVTAKGDKVDFVSRFFAPQSGIDEDPVTGSAHTTLTPFWAEKLGKTELTALQLSNRTGYLQCRHLGERVEISGQAKLYMKGEILIQQP